MLMMWLLYKMPTVSLGTRTHTVTHTGGTAIRSSLGPSIVSKDTVTCKLEEPGISPSTSYINRQPAPTPGLQLSIQGNGKYKEVYWKNVPRLFCISIFGPGPSSKSLASNSDQVQSQLNCASKQMHWGNYQPNKINLYQPNDLIFTRSPFFVSFSTFLEGNGNN